MKIAMISLMMLGAAGVGLATYMDGEEAAAPRVQEPQDANANADADKLYDLVKQARADLREMRVKAGLGVYPAGPQAGQRESDEGGEGPGEHGGREGRGEGVSTVAVRMVGAAKGVRKAVPTSRR